MKICVVGLGYVGLPLSIRLTAKFDVTGFDVDKTKIDELIDGQDRTSEFTNAEIANSSIDFTSDEKALAGHDVYIITVPTPVDENFAPDMSFLRNATSLVGKYLSSDSTVIYESTVYPGATGEICIPILEEVSGLSVNKDFYVGYSPERVSPGRGGKRIHEIEKIIASSSEENIGLLAEIYGVVTDKSLHVAPSIEVAEFAKVLENTQRDLNIALINEVSHICAKLGIKTRDVVEAAATKWNFAPYMPGFVGGHCIGVDPYYLLHQSEKLGYSAEVITAGRRVNEKMTNFVTKSVISKLAKIDKPLKEMKVAIFGLTFKENCPDARNSKTFDLVKQLSDFNLQVFCYDPYSEAINEGKQGLDIANAPDDSDTFDFIIISVPHDEFKTLGPKWFMSRLESGDPDYIFDVKSIFPNEPFGSL